MAEGGGGGKKQTTQTPNPQKHLKQQHKKQDNESLTDAVL